MRRITTVATALFAAASASAILLAGTAQAADLTQLGSVHLTKTDSTGVTTSADLACFTDGTTVTGVGTVTNPDLACTELANVNGDFTQLMVYPTRLVTAQQAPITATAQGSWGVTTINWSNTYVNPSALSKVTGDIFVY